MKLSETGLVDLKPPLVPASAAAEGRPGASIGAWYGLAILIGVALFATVDGQIFGLVAERVRLALGMSDTKLGLLQGVGGVFVLSLAAFPIGWLADRWDRRYVLAAGVLVWSAACLARGFAHNFTQLMVATIALSVGSAGVVPCIYGLIPSLFRGQTRILANSIFVVVLYLTAAGGLALCGGLLLGLDAVRPQLPLMLRHVESWRIAFWVLAAPGPLVALLLTTIRLRREEPTPVAAPHGASPAEAAQAPPRMGLIAYLRQNPRTFAGVCLGSGVIAVGAAVRGWAPIIAARIFGASPGMIGESLGLASAIGLGTGFVATVFITRRYGPRLGPKFPLRVLWVGGLVSASLSLTMLFAANATQLFVLLGMQTAIETAGTIVSPGLLQDLGPAHLRSSLISLCVVVATAISATSPVLVGAISDALKASPHGLLIAAVTVGVVGTGLASLIFAFTETPYKRTVEALA
jgi:MFS family permease